MLLTRWSPEPQGAGVEDEEEQTPLSGWMVGSSQLVHLPECWSNPLQEGSTEKQPTPLLYHCLVPQEWAWSALRAWKLVGWVEEAD